MPGSRVFLPKPAIRIRALDGKQASRCASAPTLAGIPDVLDAGWCLPRNVLQTRRFVYALQQATQFHSAIALTFGLIAALFGPAAAQRGDKLVQISRNFTAQMDRRLVEPFKSITTHGEVERGLFPLRSTGIYTEPGRRDAVAFLAGLTAEQRAI